MLSKVKKESNSSWLTKRKRSDIDIIANILNEAHKGARKTHIMYRCNLSHAQLKVYIKLLSGMKLLKLTSEEGIKTDELKTTAKGLEFLDTYRKLRVLMT